MFPSPGPRGWVQPAKRSLESQASRSAMFASRDPRWWPKSWSVVGEEPRATGTRCFSRPDVFFKPCLLLGSPHRDRDRRCPTSHRAWRMPSPALRWPRADSLGPCAWRLPPTTAAPPHGTLQAGSPPVGLPTPPGCGAESVREEMGPVWRSPTPGDAGAELASRARPSWRLCGWPGRPPRGRETADGVGHLLGAF